MYTPNSRCLDCKQWNISDICVPQLNHNSDLEIKFIHIDKYGNDPRITSLKTSSYSSFGKKLLTQYNDNGYWCYKKVRGQSLIIPARARKDIEFDMLINNKKIEEIQLKKQLGNNIKRAKMKRKSLQTIRNKIKYKAEQNNYQINNKKYGNKKIGLDKEQIHLIRQKKFKSINFYTQWNQNQKTKINVHQLLLWKSHPMCRKLQITQKKFRTTLNKAKMPQSLILECQ